MQKNEKRAKNIKSRKRGREQGAQRVPGQQRGVLEQVLGFPKVFLQGRHRGARCRCAGLLPPSAATRQHCGAGRGTRSWHCPKIDQIY